MRASFLVFAALAAVASSASAQIIYEPVQYQHPGNPSYYYGGCDARVHIAASHPFSAGSAWGRGGGWAFRSGNLHTHREVSTERTRVYTDAIPLQNAAIYGFTASDARNEAYSRQPNYFRKVDLLRAALPDASGRGLVVPEYWAEYPPAPIVRASPTTRPSGVIIIIPTKKDSSFDRA